MTNVFLLVSDLDPSGTARQLGLLARSLPRDRFRVEVGVLDHGTAPLGAELRAAGIPVRALPLRHGLDVGGVRKVRQAVAAADPAILHVWGPAAVRVSRLITRNPPRLVVSAASNPGGGLTGWLTSRRLRRADRVVAETAADTERYRRLGVPADRIAVIRPGVPPPPPSPDGLAFRRSLGIPPEARLIMTAGRLEASPGMKAAIWAFDMLRYEAPNLHLVILGDGPDRHGLEAFGRALAFDDFRIVFAGCRADLPAVLGLAEVVWVPRDRGGVTLAAEAMAAGRPVVGWQTPDLAEVIDPGETGFLVPAGERAQLAAKTHPLIHEPGLAARLGATARERAAERFGAARVVEEFSRLYTGLSP